MWDIHSYRDFLSENSGEHHVVGSALIMLATVVLLLMIVFA